jgi:hypothetical protein
MEAKTLKVSETLANAHGYYLFGGKGDVWNNTAHLSHGGMSTTLCGRAMLSTNWVRIEGVTEVGCQVCARLFDLAISLDN